MRKRGEGGRRAQMETIAVNDDSSCVAKIEDSGWGEGHTLANRRTVQTNSSPTRAL